MPSLEIAGFVALSVVAVTELTRGSEPTEDLVSACFLGLASVGVVWYGVRILYSGTGALEASVTYLSLTAAFAVLTLSAGALLAVDQYREWTTGPRAALENAR